MANGFVKEFFALYKSLPCLWNRRDPKFSDKFQNDLAIMELTKMYRELSPGATQASVRRELVTFKACLQKEHRRRTEAQMNGSPVTSQFQYYDDLSFLLGSNPAKPKAFLPSSSATKPKGILKPKNWKQANKVFGVMNEKYKTSKHFYNYHEASMLKPRSFSAEHKPYMKDKYDVMADKLRSLPKEQYCYIENVLANIFKFVEYEKQEWINTSPNIPNRQEGPKPTIANIKTEQPKYSGQASRELLRRPQMTLPDTSSAFIDYR